jgi:5-methylcytosine-specific restriction endonuclease McrA
MADDSLTIEEEDEPQGELPHPASEEIATLVRDESVRAVYRVLYERRQTPPTMAEIRDALGPEIGRLEQLDRRRRDLHPYFVVEKIRSGREVRYRLSHRKARSESESVGITEKVRAQVLQYGRCAMCGRTPLEHGVVLQVDHKLPQSWGGTNDVENLQPLCEECNRGKKNHFETLDKYGPLIVAASEHDEPHVRIGELLKAVYPNEVRSDLIEMVAHAKQYQSEWRKRLRELRELGWEYEPRKEKDPSGRFHVFWRLTKWTPWPSGDVAAEIRRRENAKQRRSKA